MRTLSGAVLVLAMALGTGGIGCSDGDADVSSQLAAFEASIAEARAAADNAQAAAASAQGTADSASAAAASAQGTAASASASAANAQGTADSASAAASNAQIAANNAQGTATSAQNSANTAQDAADVNAEAIATLANNHRFLACADGLTVEDQETSLLWERKTGTLGSGAGVICDPPHSGCPDPHDVNNLYRWSSSGTAADGSAFTDFLASLHAGSFAGHADWRLPTISELQSILVGPGVETVADADPADPASGLNATSQATACAGPLCIDPGFAAVGGPTAFSLYWSASSNGTSPNDAWLAFFYGGFVSDVSFNGKTNGFSVRAVRTGSCVL